MKNIFKKNQIIIAVLAIMIIIAGYLNFSAKNNEDKTAAVGTNESLDYDTYTDTSKDNILDGTTVTLNEDPNAVGLLNDDILDSDKVSKESSDEAANTSDEKAAKDKATDAQVTDKGTDTSAADISDEDTAKDDAKLEVKDTGEVVKADDSSKETTAKGTEKAAADEDKTTSPGEAILVSTTISADYFANARLEREQKRSFSKETLMEIVNNKNTPEDKKKEALSNMLDLTAKAKMENDTETLLEAKGFSDAVVIMSETGSVDVIINAASVTEQDIAKVEDVVKRQTGVESDKIVINPVVEQE